MSTEHIRVVARITAQAGKADEVRSVMMGMLGPTRQEAGCILYELVQNQEDPTDLVFIEEWESNANLDAHLNAPHIHEALAKLDGLLAAAPDIRRYRLVA